MGRDLSEREIEATQFLAALFAPYGGDLRCEIRCLPPRGEHAAGRPPREWYPLGDMALVSAARSCVLWSRRWEVYAGVLPRAGRQGGTSAVAGAAWLYADIDGGDGGPEGAAELLCRRNLPEPHVTVRSGGGLHCYWKLAEAVLLADDEARAAFKAILRRVVLAVGGSAPRPHADPAAAEPARILRVPGTTNHKRVGEPRPVTLETVNLDAEALELEEWDRLLPHPPAPARGERREYVAEGIVTPGLRRWAEQGYPEGHRHMDLAGAAAWLIRDCRLPRDVAEELLLIKAARSPGRRSISEIEIRKIVRWA